MTIEVRKIQSSDIEGFHSALDSVVCEGRFLLTSDRPALENVTEFIRANIADNNAQYVAVENGNVIGWVDIVPYKKELIKHVGLLGMGVISKYRGQGVGKTLLASAIEHAKNNGLKRIELEVFAYNAPAIALYEKLGFEHEGLKRSARYINEKYEDVCFMAQCYN